MAAFVLSHRHLWKQYFREMQQINEKARLSSIIFLRLDGAYLLGSEDPIHRCPNERLKPRPKTIEHANSTTQRDASNNYCKTVAYLVGNYSDKVSPESRCPCF